MVLFGSQILLKLPLQPHFTMVLWHQVNYFKLSAWARHCILKPHTKLVFYNCGTTCQEVAIVAMLQTACGNRCFAGTVSTKPTEFEMLFCSPRLSARVSLNIYFDLLIWSLGSLCLCHATAFSLQTAIFDLSTWSRGDQKAPGTYCMSSYFERFYPCLVSVFWFVESNRLSERFEMTWRL